MEYIFSIIVIVGIYVILSSSFNLIIGYGGLISIAHPVFFAMGAYASGLVSRDLGVPIYVAIPIGGIVAMAMSILLSLPSLRVSGDYLLIASIGFQLGLLQIIKNMEFMGASSGLSNIPGVANDVTERGLYVLLVLAVTVAVVWVIRWVISGSYGRAVAAMRDDELAFRTLGRNAMWIKIAVFALGSGFAGIAGGLYAHYFRFVSPEQFDILMSATILTMVVVGGMGTTWGPVIGAVLLQILPQAITFLNLPPSILGPLQGILFTGLVLIFLFVRPGGFMGATWTWRSPATMRIARNLREGAGK